MANIARKKPEEFLKQKESIRGNSAFGLFNQENVVGIFGDFYDIFKNILSWKFLKYLDVSTRRDTFISGVFDTSGGLFFQHLVE